VKWRIPQFLLDLGFEDYSYNNDAAARMVKGDFHVWVAEVNPEEREFPESKRYSLLRMTDFDDATADVLLETDSEAELTARIKELSN
jgi:hypothetical protein